MRLNRDQVIGRFANVFLNGQKLDDCFEASEEDGYVIVEYRDVNGNRVVHDKIEKGGLVIDGLQVLKLTGNVRIEIDTGTFVPLNITVKE